jgi:hypothetical protein
MNNSDFQDFQNWQNGDDNWQEEMRKYFSSNPSFKNGFFYYNPMSNSFKKLWEKINSNEDPTENLKDYLNIDDLIGENKQISKKPNRNRNGKTIMFTQEEYQRLIEIRGYLAITEQRAHVKALDKVLSHIKMIPQPPTR